MDAIDQNYFLGKTIKNYYIEDFIDQGWSGYVFKVSLPNLGFFAIKIIKPEITKNNFNYQLNRVKRQLKLKGKYHPNLVSIIEVDTFEFKEAGSNVKIIYTVMEFFSPELYIPLDKMKLERPIQSKNVLSLISQIASSAEFLHNNGIIHRDIKPSNILIKNDQSRAILLDLGIIKIGGDSLDNIKNPNETSESDGFLGTSAYSPKEFLLNKITDDYNYEALSFYQLGLILFELLSKSALFPKSISYAEIIQTITVSGILSYIKIQDSSNDDILIKLMQNSLDIDWVHRLTNVGWDDFNFDSLIPTIVILYAGGTIGSVSSNNGERGLRDLSKDLDLFYTPLKKRIERDFRQIFNEKSRIPFYIEPDSLSIDQVILSENATPCFWNNIQIKVEEIIIRHSKAYIKDSTTGRVIERNNKYLSGIIILHGTDTLAYTASALTLGMKNLPCPIIITGSNQPPNEEKFNEKEILLSTSDAWKNLRLSINFIQTIGHRYTEVFVAFNATIYHGINLTKVPIYYNFETLNSFENLVNEPYSFQNAFLPNKYAFKYIDGIFCNNLYSIQTEDNEEISYDFLVENYFHIRTSVFQDDNKKFEVFRYTDSTQLIFSAPVSNSNGDIFEISKDCLLIIGYESGTFGSNPEHPIFKLVQSWLKNEKLVVIISEFGLFPSEGNYSVHEEFLHREKIINIYGMVKETAIPFLIKCNYLLQCKFADRKLISYEKLISEFKLILVNDSHYVNSLPVFLLGNPFNRVAVKKRLENSFKTNSLSENELINKFNENRDAITRIKYICKTLDNKISTKPDGVIIGDIGEFRGMVQLEKEAFKWSLLSEYYKLNQFGVGPNAFKNLLDSGFILGKELYKIVTKNVLDDDEPLDDFQLLAKLNESEPSHDQKIKKLVSDAKKTLQYCHKIFFENGTLDTVKHNFDLLRGTKSIILEYSVQIRHDSTWRRNPKYAIKYFDENESNYFASLAGGSKKKKGVRFPNEIKEKLKDLNNNCTWNQFLDPYDWYTIGLCKGLFYKCLLELKIDEWVQRFNLHPEVKYEIFLRESIETSIEISNDKFLKFKLSYESREVFLDDSRI